MIFPYSAVINFHDPLQKALEFPTGFNDSACIKLVAQTRSIFVLLFFLQSTYYTQRFCRCGFQIEMHV